MTAAIRSLVPMIHVQDVDRSILFYTKLGLRTQHTFAPEGSEVTAWAELVSERARLMVTRASEPVGASEQAVIFYVYCDDVAEARAALIEQGVDASPIEHPFYAPRGEFRVVDPDGYALMVTHT